MPGTPDGPPAERGLVRDRLLALSRCRVVLVAAPAGHGKSTLLAQLARRADGPVVWYRADAADRGAVRLLRRLTPPLLHAAGLGEEAARPGTGSADAEAAPATDPGGIALLDPAGHVAGQVPGQVAGQVAGLVDRLGRARPPGDVLLVLDDVHVVTGSAGGDAVLELVRTRPPWLRILLATRVDGDLDALVEELDDHACRVDADDLRFRSWEVERLFREVYRRPLRPEDAATLTARTEGWAAGLAMFELLTRSRSPAGRRQALSELARGSHLVRTYLVREVLADLAPDLGEFLRLTSALGVLTGRSCDALLDRTGSQGVLEELERRRIFTSSDDGLRFRYHQVLQDHLELELSERLGPEAARAWYRRAGLLLEEDGEAWASFRAFVRAQDWASVERVLSAHGADIVDRPSEVLAESLPAALRERDPWLVLAAARVLSHRGSLPRAIAAYQRAESLTEDADVRDLCRRERLSLVAWLPEGRPPVTTPAGVTRAATQHGPARCVDLALGLSGAEAVLAAGAAALLAGTPWRADELFGQAAERPDLDATGAALASYGTAVARYLLHDPQDDAGTLEGLLREPSRVPALPTSWLRLGAGLVAAARGDRAALSVLTDEADTDDDQWGGALLRLLAGLAGRSAALVEAEEMFSALEAPVLVHWARCARLVARGDAEATAALQREGRSLGAREVTATVQALVRARRGAAQAAWTGPSTGSLPLGPAAPAPRGELPAAPSPSRDPLRPDQPTAAARPAEGTDRAEGTGTANGGSGGRSPLGPVVTVRLFGGFEIAVDGAVVDLSAVRPRVRALLQYLALHAGTFVHRDTLAAALWPEADDETGRRGVQVAVSALRGLLQPGYPRQSTVVPRRGNAYALIAGGSSTSDVLDLERLAARARTARASGDVDRAVADWRRVAQLYRGELLPEQGSAEWVVHDRERLRLVAADALEGLGRVLVTRDAVDEGIGALLRALDLDRFRDGTWRTLIEVYESLGDLAAAAAARRRHRHVLVELGVPVDED